MPTQEEIHLAARLVHHDVVSRSTMEECLRACGQPQQVALSKVLVDRGILTQEEVDAYSGLPLESLQPIPGYRVGAEIGEGGMATIHRATYLPLDREVALKVMRPELARVERHRIRFFREAGILRHLDHPNIVKVFEDGHAGPWHYFAMQHVPGLSLLERIEKEGTLTEPQALKIVRQIADAMGLMARHGVLHRDLKPGNILVTDRYDAVIIDLGLAKLVAGMREDGAEGTTVGTVEYISPEQARGRAVDVRSDIYSLGVTLYHSLVGEVPFSGEDRIEIMAKQILSALRSPRLRKLSPVTRSLIEKMMAKDAEARYQGPAQIVEDIDARAGDVVAIVEEEVRRRAEAEKRARIGRLMRGEGRSDDAPARRRPARRGRGTRRRRRK